MAKKLTTKPKRVRKLKKFKAFKSVKSTFRSAIRKANKNRPPSSIELLVYSWLEEDGIPFKKEKAIGRCHVDIFLEPNIVVELNGDFWHRNICCYPEPTKENLAARRKDSKRYAFFESRGFKVFVLTECQIKKNPDQSRKKIRDICNDRNK